MQDSINQLQVSLAALHIELVKHFTVPAEAQLFFTNHAGYIETATKIGQNTNSIDLIAHGKPGRPEFDVTKRFIPQGHPGERNTYHYGTA